MAWLRVTGVVVACSWCLAASATAQIPGQNVNMVSGREWPGGDPFLQRQNEPSMAVSSRNPLHILAGANDYRTVDLPGLPNGGVTGDAWLGLFTSTNGGGRWTSTLLPGYPQDTSPEGLSSPIKGLQAGADAVVKPGSHGLFYYGGLAFNRGENQPSAIFMARYQDQNNTETGSPFKYTGTSVIARNATGEFLDKPSFAADIPRAGARTCSIDGVPTPGGAVYAAWTVFLGPTHPHGGRDDRDDDDEGNESGSTTTVRSRIMFSRSLDCGVSWSAARRLSDSRTNQGSAIAIDPRNGHVYVAWRQFDTFQFIHAIFVRKSTDGGRTFGPAIPVWGFLPFDQGTTNTSFRTNSYPAIAVDHTGRVYVAWAARGYAPDHDPFRGDARIVMSTSSQGLFWTFPRAVDSFPERGHQFMPALTYAGGKLQLIYYDLREDVSGFFQRFVDELSILQLPPGTPGKRRHTLDVRTAQADPAVTPRFSSYSVTDTNPSSQASRYLFGSRAGSTEIQQLQFNPPNLPLFALGTTPFIGDYIDVAARTIIPVRNLNGSSGWRYTRPGDEAVFHLVWTDNRDVKPPADGQWANYTPPTFAGSGGPSTFDPNQPAPVCTPGQAGMRNQNIYTSRVTPGLVAGTPANAKQLSTTLQRAFVVFAQNTTSEHAAYRFRILDQPVGGHASFLQFDALPATAGQYDTVAVLEPLLAPAKSSVARTVYVTSTDPRAQVRVEVVQVAAAGAGAPPPEGRSSAVILNPDIDNPDIDNPDIDNAEIYNPDIDNPDIDNPDIDNPDIDNPDIDNPDIDNAAIGNIDISNPDIDNPDIDNPDIDNPDIDNPDIDNPDIDNGSITDYSYTVTTTGNTSEQVELNIASATEAPENVDLQVIIHRIYQTPVLTTQGCGLTLQTQRQVIGNFANPAFVDFADLGTIDPFDGSLDNITFWLQPGEQVEVTIRVIDRDRNDGVTFDPTRDATIAVVSASVSTNLPPGSAPESAVSGNPLVVTNTNDSGFGSLRFAMEYANRHANGEGADVISFNIPGEGVRRISPAGLLPAVTDPVVIDATTQPGWDGVPVVVVDGAHTIVPDGVDGGYGIGILAGSSTVRGLAVVNAPGRGVVLSTGGGNLVEFAWIGIDPATGRAAPNRGESGLAMLRESGGNLISSSVISGNAGSGVGIHGGVANVVHGNSIGLDASGTGAVPNAGEGIFVSGGSNHRIGGDAAGQRNVVSGNRGVGIYIQGATGVAILGNHVGVDASGLKRLGNGGNGIQMIDSPKNVVGGSAAERNVISANTGEGLRIDGALSVANHVRGNFVGVSASGAADFGNAASGIYIRRAPANVIENNVVSGNDGFAGIAICGTQSFCGGGDAGTPGSAAGGNIVRGNHIGTDAAGKAVLGNSGYGVSIDGAPNTAIGGIGQGNVIRANGSAGVIIFAGATGTVVSENVVAQNATGVFVEGPSTLGNLITRNSLTGNTHLNLDLAPTGVTANDPLDRDQGPNSLQNFPVIERATVGYRSLVVAGTIDSSPAAQVTVEIFRSTAACQGGGGGPAAVAAVGTATVLTDEEGKGSFVIEVPAGVSAGTGITATATASAPGGGSNTSEISACVIAYAPIE